MNPPTNNRALNPGVRITPQQMNPGNPNVTGREEVINSIGQENYNDRFSPYENFVSFINSNGELRAPITINNWDFTIEGGNANWWSCLSLPREATLGENCRLISENCILIIYRGEITTIAPNSKIELFGDDTVGNANAENTTTVAFEGATANANSNHSLAIAMGNSRANATTFGAVAQANAQNAMASASNGGTIVPFGVRERTRPQQIGRGLANQDGAMANNPIAQQEDVEQAMDDSRESFIQHSAHQIGQSYNEPGNIKATFKSQVTDDAKVNDAIKDYIQTNLATLLTVGMRVGTAPVITIFLQEGRDCISLQPFQSTNIEDANAKWCLLSQGKKNGVMTTDGEKDNVIIAYNFITEETAMGLISAGNNHPFFNVNLVAGDLLAGKALLDLIDVKTIRNARPPAAIPTKNKNCIIS